MKSKLFCFLALAVLPVALFGTASIFGTALVNVTGVADSDFAVVLVDTSGSDFNTAALATLAANADLTSSSTYSGFEVLVTTAASNFLSNDIVVAINAATFNVVSSTVASGDSFGILTFSGGSTTSVAASTYEIWTDATWVIPADGATNTFSNSDLAQLVSVSAGSTGTVGTTNWYSGASFLQDGWRYFEWFKGFKPEGPNWIYHGRHGWLYTLGQDPSGIFLWDGALGRWMYTNETAYPWMYAYGADGGWVFFFEGGDNGQVLSEQNLSLNP